MKEKREKMIRDYLYEEESNKTLTAKDIVSRIDFSTPQVKPQVRRKKKSKLKVALVCLSYILIAFFTSIITYSVVTDIFSFDIYKNNNTELNIYNQSYFQNDIVVSVYYKINGNTKIFYIRNSTINKSVKLENFTISYDDKEINVNANEVTYFATLKENEELEFDILYNGEQRHCIIQNLN
mgnify:CR=1 FL=1